MNTLSSYISESLLDIDNVDSSDALTEEFLKKNYKIDGSYTIKGGVVDIKGSITVINKDITQLTNGLFRFGKVEGYFDCRYSKSLKSLEGAPEEVGLSFICSYCDSLTSLEGAPQQVGLGFFCASCKSLKSLKGAPERVGKIFHCDHCYSLKSLKGAPKVVDEEVECSDCGKQFTKEDVMAVSKVKKYIYL